MVSSTREIKHFINGQFVGSKSGKTFNNVNPINGQIIAKVHEGESEEISHAVDEKGHKGTVRFCG